MQQAAAQRRSPLEWCDETLAGLDQRIADIHRQVTESDASGVISASGPSPMDTEQQLPQEQQAQRTQQAQQQRVDRMTRVLRKFRQEVAKSRPVYAECEEIRARVVQLQQQRQHLEQLLDQQQQLQQQQPQQQPVPAQLTGTVAAEGQQQQQQPQQPGQGAAREDVEMTGPEGPPLSSAAAAAAAAEAAAAEAPPGAAAPAAKEEGNSAALASMATAFASLDEQEKSLAARVADEQDSCLKEFERLTREDRPYDFSDELEELRNSGGAFQNCANVCGGA